MKLFLDLETFSPVDLKKSGAHKYAADPGFKILLLGYAIDGGPACALDWQAATEAQRKETFRVIKSASEIVAHNAQFERVCLRAAGLDLPASSFLCTSVLAAASGLPMSLEEACEELDLEHQKNPAGKALIRLFCVPQKRKKTSTLEIWESAGSGRVLPESFPDKWQAFTEYLLDDVAATRGLFNELTKKQNIFPKSDYTLDQIINDRGIQIDEELVKNSIELDKETTHKLTVELRAITGGNNPNSGPQFLKWYNEATGENISNLTADTVTALKDRAADLTVKRALHLKQQTSLASVAKYKAAAAVVESDGRGRGLLKFFGAGRTGRWAGSKIQVQNMPRNYLNTLSTARALVREGAFDTLDLLYDDQQHVLKQLLRSMLIPKPGKTFVIADFSAIEARVIAWLAEEAWRLRVFEGHGKIYEASASAMFNVPIEEVTKGSTYRARAKVAELALGYQGSVGALKAMGAEKMGLGESDMRMIVKRWRKSNPAIVQLWSDVEDAAIHSVQSRKKVKVKSLEFDCDGEVFSVLLPRKRPIIYRDPKILAGSLTYMGAAQQSRKWTRLDTYGGKLVENIVQAIARDLLMCCLHRAEVAGFNTVMHVHDELICEETPRAGLVQDLTEIMAEPVPWAPGLTLAGDGFLTDYYLKD